MVGLWRSEGLLLSKLWTCWSQLTVSKEGTGTPSGQEMIWLLVQLMFCVMPGTGQLGIPGQGWMWSRGC